VPKNEDGEFELILGNRQLLSVFFIVIVLFALFFVMGYILGRNSGPLAPEAGVRKTEKPLVVESPGRDNPPPVRKAEPPAAPPDNPQPRPEARREEPAKVERTPEPKPEPVKAPPQERKAEKAPPPATASNEPASGTYLQLAATSEREADLEAEKLRKKGFKTVVAEIPDKRGMFRVLVGPLSDGSVNKTKADLQSSGFPGDKAIKRTY
jgi:outer membrane biosynthesis protein TonB